MHPHDRRSGEYSFRQLSWQSNSHGSLQDPVRETASGLVEVPLEELMEAKAKAATEESPVPPLAEDQ